MIVSCLTFVGRKSTCIVPKHIMVDYYHFLKECPSIVNQSDFVFVQDSGCEVTDQKTKKEYDFR